MKYREVLKQKEFVKYMIANAISRFGDSIDAISFTWLVYEITGSASYSAIIFGLNKLPTIFLQPFMGALGDTLNRKKLILLSHFARLVSVSFIIYSLFMHSVTPFTLALFTLFISSFEAINMPCSIAFTTELLEKKYYAEANALSYSMNTICELVGTCIAGILIGFFGIQFAFFVDAGSFLFTILIESTIHPVKEKEIEEKKESYFVQLKKGVEYIKENPFARNVIVLAVIANALFVPMSSLQAPIVEEIYLEKSTFLSFLSASQIIGLLIGTYFMPNILKKYSMKKILFTSIFLVCIFIIFYANGKYVRTYLIMKYVYSGSVVLAIGALLGILNGSLDTYFMQTLDSNYLGRCAAFMNAAGSFAMPISSFLVSFSLKYIGVSTILQLSSVICIILMFFLAKKMNF